MDGAAKPRRCPPTRHQGRRKVRRMVTIVPAPSPCRHDPSGVVAAAGAYVCRLPIDYPR